MKFDVYSFGVLLLHIISGKRSSCFYGIEGNLNLLDHVSRYLQRLSMFCIIYMGKNLELYDINSDISGI